MAISDGKYIDEVCLIGKGKKCCRYLGVSANGFECFKLDNSLKSEIDKRISFGLMTAQGDNCKGYGVN
jgi:hypothetical protein